jgi:hypothetical protein
MKFGGSDLSRLHKSIWHHWPLPTCSFGFHDPALAKFHVFLPALCSFCVKSPETSSLFKCLDFRCPSGYSPGFLIFYALSLGGLTYIYNWIPQTRPFGCQPWWADMFHINLLTTNKMYPTAVWMHQKEAKTVERSKFHGGELLPLTRASFAGIPYPKEEQIDPSSSSSWKTCFLLASSFLTLSSFIESTVALWQATHTPACYF